MAVFGKAKKGTKLFKELKEQIRDSYVDAHYPGKTSYAYQADQISIEDGEQIMEEILSNMVEIDWADPGVPPSFRLKGEPSDKWRYVEDTDDFPAPDTEPFGDDDEKEDEEEAGHLTQIERNYLTSVPIKAIHARRTKDPRFEEYELVLEDGESKYLVAPKTLGDEIDLDTHMGQPASDAVNDWRLALWAADQDPQLIRIPTVGRDPFGPAYKS